jgi:hypothetical protein
MPDFILTFRDNSNHILDVVDGKVCVSSKLIGATKTNDITYIGKDEKDYLEFRLPAAKFLSVKDDERFQRLCHNLVRLRTIPAEKPVFVLDALCMPLISIFDNKLPSY